MIESVLDAATITAIPSAFPPRWAAAWAAGSARPPWTGWSGTYGRRRCWTRSTGSRGITGERVSNVVVMGSGEPMDNYDNLIRFIRLLTRRKRLEYQPAKHHGLHLRALCRSIRRLAEEGLQITLALSLHAPNDEMRKTLMPMANSYTLKDVLEACRYYYEKTGRRLTFEYSLVKGVNDNLDEAARRWRSLLRISTAM